MPIYTYKCEYCHNTFEKKQRMSDEPLKECVLCNSSGVRRVVNSVGIVFKGNGFYVTDTRAKNSAATSTTSTTTESTSSEKKAVAPESSGNGSAKAEAPRPRPDLAGAGPSSPQ